MQRLEVSGAVRLIYRSLGVKGLIQFTRCRHISVTSMLILSFPILPGVYVPHAPPFSSFFICFLPWRNSPSGPRPPHCRGFAITLRHTTLGRTPLDEWSARRTDLYQTTHNTHNRQTSMPLAWIEPAIPASKGPQTHALDRVITGIGSFLITHSLTHSLTPRSRVLLEKLTGLQLVKKFPAFYGTRRFIAALSSAECKATTVPTMHI